MKDETGAPMASVVHAVHLVHGVGGSGDRPTTVHPDFAVWPSCFFRGGWLTSGDFLGLGRGGARWSRWGCGASGCRSGGGGGFGGLPRLLVCACGVGGLVGRPGWARGPVGARCSEESPYGDTTNRKKRLTTSLRTGLLSRSERQLCATFAERKATMGPTSVSARSQVPRRRESDPLVQQARKEGR